MPHIPGTVPRELKYVVLKRGLSYQWRVLFCEQVVAEGREMKQKMAIQKGRAARDAHRAKLAEERAKSAAMAAKKPKAKNPYARCHFLFAK
jgi:hypothetical protein